MRKEMKSLAILSGVGMLFASLLGAADASVKKDSRKLGDVFYIYTDRGSRLNHYIPSGWMGDYGDLKLNPAWGEGVKKPEKGMSKEDVQAVKSKEDKDTCIQIKYTAERKQGAGWAGIYWQHPANNWGDKRGGFDLTKFRKLSFWARGEKGGEVVDKFFIGGITGQTEEGDSDEAAISPVELTKDWKKYEIDLAGLDLSHIIGGFGFAANGDANPDGFTIYIDEIKLAR